MSDDGRPDLYVANFCDDSNTLYHNRTERGGEALFNDLTFASGISVRVKRTRMKLIDRIDADLFWFYPR